MWFGVVWRWFVVVGGGGFRVVWGVSTDPLIG